MIWEGEKQGEAREDCFAYGEFMDGHSAWISLEVFFGQGFRSRFRLHRVITMDSRSSTSSLSLLYPDKLHSSGRTNPQLETGFEFIRRWESAKLLICTFRRKFEV